MKKILCGILLMYTVCTFLFAQENPGYDKKSKTGIGLDYALVNRKNNFGVSAALTSPWLFTNSLAFRADTGYFFPSEEHSNGFLVLDGSVMGGHIMKTANIRLYGGGGVVVLFPMEDGEATGRISGHGFFGFEYFMTEEPSGFSFFTEMGGGGFGFHAKAGMRYSIPVN